MLASHASLVKRNQEAGQQALLEPPEQAASRTGLAAADQPCRPRPGEGPWLVWLRAILCAFFLQRWFSLHDLSVEDALYASPAHRFVQAGWDRPATSREMIARPSRHLPEERDLPQSGASQALSSSRPEFDISWRTPWLYVSFVLLAWLLLL